LNLQGPFWNFFATLGEEFGTIGYLIIGLFVFTLVIAKIVHKYGGYEKLEHKFDQRNIRDLDIDVNDELNQGSGSKHSINIVVDSHYSQGSIEIHDN